MELVDYELKKEKKMKGSQHLNFKVKKKDILNSLCFINRNSKIYLYFNFKKFKSMMDLDEKSRFNRRRKRRRINGSFSIASSLIAR